MQLAALTHVIVDNPPDAATIQALHDAWATYNLTFAALLVGGFALLIAFVALGVTIFDARNNSRQLQMLIEERLRKPDVRISWDDDADIRYATVTAKSVFGNVGAISLPVRASNPGTLTAHDVTILFGIPREAKLRNQMLRSVQMRLGGQDWTSVRHMHESGFFAHECRSVADDGSRTDDWDIGTIKINATKDFGSLNLLLPQGTHHFNWSSNCDEGVLTNGTLTLVVALRPA